MTSLAELRMIEEQRIVGERNARLAEDAARVAALDRAERELREAEASRIAEERAAALAIEQARVTAEREARMRAESAHATEQMRLSAELEARRLEHEVELRRAEVAKTRPTWMVAVTACAVVATIALGVFAVDRMRSAAASTQDRDAAVAERERIRQDAAAQTQRLHELDTQSAGMDARIAQAIKDVERAQGAAALAGRNAELKRIQQEKRELDARRAETAFKKWKKDRVGPIRIKDECLTGAIGRNGC